MKIVIIPPTTRTGEAKYGKYLVKGLINSKVNVELINNRILLNRPNIKILIGSLLINKIIDNDTKILHNLDNLGPFLFKNSNSKIKRVSTIHDIAPVILPDIHNNIIKFNFNWILPRLIDNSDFLIVDSNATKTDLIHRFGVDSKLIETIPLGVDTSFFNFKKSVKEILNKYGIYNKYLLYVGTDSPRKNLKNLIIAFEKVMDVISHDLVLIGVIDQENLTKFIKNKFNSSYNKLLNRILMPGYVEYNDLPLIYSGADVFVFPSLYEGFGFPPLESMACGTPVIVSNNSSIPEVVGDAGVYLNDPLDPDEIASSVIKTIDNEKLIFKLKTKGLIQAKKFTWQTTIEKTLKVYEKLYMDNY